MRRLTVALSRARLGLYILGRRDIFESCYELKEAFSLLLQRPDKLKIVVRETFPASRGAADEVEDVEMDGVEHLGQYVFEMTQAKIASLKAGSEGLPAIEQQVEDDDDNIHGDPDSIEKDDAEIEEDDEEEDIQ